MGDLLESFSESVRVGRKHAGNTRVGVWGWSAILKAFFEITNGIRADLFKYDVVRGRT